MSGIAVVSNPRSRQNRKNPALSGQMSFMLGTRGKVAQPQSREDLVEQARRFRDEGVDIVAVNGGDGTLHVVLTAFLEAYGDTPLPPVAILRGGTMNTIARGLGVRGTPESLLSALLLRYHTDQPMPWTERSILRIEGGEKPEYGFLFGNGLLGNFLREHYAAPNPSPFTAALLLTRAVCSAAVNGPLIQRLSAPTECEVEVDGGRWPAQRFLTVTMGTVDDIGFGFRPFYEALRHPGRMHALGFACDALGVVKCLPRIRLAQPIRSPDVYSAVPERVVLRSPAPMPFMVDGDFHPAGQTLTVTVGPRIRFLLP
jgi:diacylglycerol kinase family enzyme